MAITSTAVGYAQRRLTRRLVRTVPWVASALALLTLGSAIRRKGLFGGTLHTALDAIPVVGGVKNLVEAVRGRDFIADRTTQQVLLSHHTEPTAALQGPPLRR